MIDDMREFSQYLKLMKLFLFNWCYFRNTEEINQFTRFWFYVKQVHHLNQLGRSSLIYTEVNEKSIIIWDAVPIKLIPRFSSLNTSTWISLQYIHRYCISFRYGQICIFYSVFFKKIIMKIWFKESLLENYI